MKNKIYTYLIVFVLTTLANTNLLAWDFTWNGSSSTDWATSANWTRTGTGGANTVPGSSDDVYINNGALGNQPQLSGNVTIDDLTVTAGVLDLNGYTLTTDHSDFRNATVTDGTIYANNFDEIRNMVIQGLMIFYKQGNGNDDIYGGNTVSGPVAFVNNSGSRFRLAINSPDNFAVGGVIHCEENSTGAMEPGYNGNNLVNGDISSQGSTNTVTWGAGNGVVIAGGNGTVYGDPVINRLVINTTQAFQLQTNSDLVVSTLKIIKGTFDLNQKKLTASTLTIVGGTTEDGELEFVNIDSMQGAVFNGTLIFTKLAGGSNNTVRGGNTFNQDITFNNNSTSSWTLANVVGDEFAGGTVTFNQLSSGLLRPAYNGTNNFKGNISFNSSTAGITFGANNGVVVFNGNTSQFLWNNTAYVPTFRRVVINTTGTVNLGNNTLFSLNLTFTKGIINSSQFSKLFLADNISVSGTSNIGHVVGPMTKIGNDAFTFPVGDGAFYAPISISAPSNSSVEFTAQYFNTAYPSLAVNSGLDHVSTEEYWQLDLSGTTSPINVTLSWNTDRSGPVDDLSRLRVAKFTGSTWDNQGSSSTSGSFYTGTVTSNSVSSFSPFTLGSSTQNFNPLPISLLDFNAVALNNNVLVKWTTTNEINNDFFTIEKSLDGKSWMDLGRVKGAEQSDITLDYQLIDENPILGLQFYRLKQTDKNGVFSYSSIAPVRFDEESSKGIVIFPQPAGNTLNVSINNADQTEFSLNLYNSMGQVIFERSNLNGNIYQIDMTDFASGLYYLEINQDGLISKMKVIKQ